MGDYENIFDLKMNIELKKDDNGNKYYNIPAGTKIYRGGYPADMHKNAFFGFNPDHVKQYGSVTEYTIKENLKVLAIMEMDTSSKFYTLASGEIKTALDQSYSYSNIKKIRDSIPAYDYAVVNHICNKRDYDGYAMHDKYTSDSGGKFHAELVICDCYDRVEQGAKGPQAPPRVRKNRPVVKQTNFYFVEEEKKSSTSSLFGTPKRELLFSSPLGTPQEGILGNRLEKTPETPKGFIPFNLTSPDTKSPEKENLERDENEARSMLFGSPQQDPNKLKTKYNEQGMKDHTVRSLNFGGGTRKTKRRNRKTKNKTKRHNRRTRKGGLFRYKKDDVMEIIKAIKTDIDNPTTEMKIINDHVLYLEGIKNYGIEPCTSWYGHIDKDCERTKIDKIYEGILNSITLLNQRYMEGDPTRKKLVELKNYFTDKKIDHEEKIGDYTTKNTMKNTRKDKIDIRELNTIPDDGERRATTNRKTVGFEGGKRKTKRRKTRTKRRRNRRIKKVKH
jgi:hypothetical protein